MSRTKRRWPLITESNPQSPISEAYKMLRTNVAFSNLDDEIRTIMVTSSTMGEGKSTTSANIAVTYAQAHRTVLLIDADMRKPTQHHIFDVSNRGGLTSVLSQQQELKDALLTTSIAGLSILPSGPIPPNPSEMLVSRRMNALLETASRLYDVVIIDTPPIMMVTDAQIVASKCDGVVLVIDSGHVKRESARKAKASLEHVNARLLGVVLNNVKRSKAESYYAYYGEQAGSS
ncbi:polysaccharide biosynthesis tyrosine autokinase [Paenibacillus sp. IB182496]|uniref:non-specific protein-tyrosine kinase n=1 Tax=Paenibacillus sabuli TaxID=2772509 RepID=A0A927GUE3_9BACL|nr:polysaccharide biosynthesis tyrosine autokinase [Paenibacillus sabuli]MBD2848583.1 polysaccharide biosynthesis tyrosine autokinase [Paenibacillus sabuli]